MPYLIWLKPTISVTLLTSNSIAPKLLATIKSNKLLNANMEGHTNHKMTCLIVLFNFRGPTVTQSITGRARYKNHASMFLITQTPPCFPPTWSTWSVPKWSVPKSSYYMFLLHVPTSCSYAACSRDCSMACSLCGMACS